MTIRTELQTKLKDLRLALGYKNQVSFAEKLGVSQAAIANMEGGKRDVSKPILLKIREVFNIDLISWREGQENEPVKVSRNIIPIPFYNVGAAAGNGNYLLDEIPEEDVLYFDERWLKNILGVNPDNLHLIFADGDSMDSGFDTKEDIKDKDLLLVDTSQLTGNNKIFVILVNNTELRVKRLFKKMDGSLIISSNNPKYPDEIYNSDSPDIDIKVIGKVVWNGSKENI